MIELYPFQREDVDKFINEGHKSGLFAYDMALGKTLTATTLTVELGTKINLIVAPQVTYHGWASAIKEQAGEELQWIKNSSKAGKQALADFYYEKPGWYFITWQLLRTSLLYGQHADMVIADEVHEIQNKRGARQWQEIMSLVTEYKIGLSGTPSGNKMTGIYGVLAWLFPKKYTSYWKWLKSNFVLVGNGFAFEPVREIVPGKVTADIPFYVRRLKSKHYAGMMPTPEPRQEVYVTLTPAQRGVYDTLLTTGGTPLGEGFVFTPDVLAKIIRLREIALGVPTVIEEDGEDVISFKEDCESPKVDALLNIVKQSDETFVVYTHSKKFIPALVSRLNQAGISARPFTGDLNYNQKRKAIDEFGKEFRVLVATQSSIGTGTDGLQKVCRNMVVMSRDVKMIVNEQARERLYRPGQTQPVRTWEIIARDTHDLATNANTDAAQEMVGAMLDANAK